MKPFINNVLFGLECYFIKYKINDTRIYKINKAFIWEKASRITLFTPKFVSYVIEYFIFNLFIFYVFQVYAELMI